MRLAILPAIPLIFSLQLSFAKENVSSDSEKVSATAVIHELNLSRQDPSLYSNFVAEARPLHMIEHGRAVDEAIHFRKKRDRCRQ